MTQRRSWSLSLCSFLLQVAKYLLDGSTVMDEESLYEASLRIEPKTSSWGGSRLLFFCSITPHMKCTGTLYYSVHILLFVDEIGCGLLVCAPQCKIMIRHRVDAQRGFIYILTYMLFIVTNVFYGVVFYHKKRQEMDKSVMCWAFVFNARQWSHSSHNDLIH